MKQSANGNGKRIVLGAAASMAVYLGLLALASLLIVRGTVGEGRGSLCALLAAGAAALVGAKLAARGGDGWLLPAASCAAFGALVVLAGFLSFDTLAPERLPGFAAAVCAGGAPSLLPGAKRKKRGRRSRR